MAKEIILAGEDYTGANPLYAIAWRVSDTKFINGTSFEDRNNAHWTAYALPLTFNSPTGEYFADFPAVPNDTYYVAIYEQLGGSPAPSDATPGSIAEGEYVRTTQPSGTFPDQFAVDSSCFFMEFAEPIVFMPDGPDGGESLNLMAIVRRHLPEVVAEDGKTTTQHFEIDLMNDEDNGVTSVNEGRAFITVAEIYGGSPKNYLVTKVLQSDAGVITVRVR